MSQKESLSQPLSHNLWYTYNTLHEGHIRIYTAYILTRRDEGVLDCIALDEVALYAVHTLNDVSIKSLHIAIAHSTDCQSVLRITLE